MKISRWTLPALAFAAALPAQAQAQAQAPGVPAPQVYPNAAQIAETLQSRLPMDLGNQIRAVAITAEGRTLVWTLDVPAGLVEGHSAQEVADAVTVGFCRGAGAAMFDHGVSLRIDTSSNGATPVRGLVIYRCPSAIAQ